MASSASRDTDSRCNGHKVAWTAATAFRFRTSPIRGCTSNFPIPTALSTVKQLAAPWVDVCPGKKRYDLYTTAMQTSKPLTQQDGLSPRFGHEPVLQGTSPAGKPKGDNEGRCSVCQIATSECSAARSG